MTTAALPMRAALTILGALLQWDCGAGYGNQMPDVVTLPRAYCDSVLLQCMLDQYLSSASVSHGAGACRQPDSCWQAKRQLTALMAMGLARHPAGGPKGSQAHTAIAACLIQAQLSLVFRQAEQETAVPKSCRKPAGFCALLIFERIASCSSCHGLCRPNRLCQGSASRGPPVVAPRP